MRQDVADCAVELDDDVGMDVVAGQGHYGRVEGHRGPIGSFGVGHKYLVQPHAVEDLLEDVAQHPRFDVEEDAASVHLSSGHTQDYPSLPQI